MRQSPPRRTVRWICAFFFLLLSSSAPYVMAQQASAFTPETKEAMRRGLAAAKQQEWTLAIKYFTEARKTAPQAAPVLFNLAFANDQLGGGELVALAWYRAYLAAAPRARNAPRIRERIFELEVKTEATASKLIAQAKKAAAQLPDEFDRKYNLKKVLTAQARTGDIEGALAEAASLEDHNDVFDNIAVIQAQRGDIAAAMATANRIEAGAYKASAYAGIAKAQANAGEVAAALNTASRILSVVGESRDYALERQSETYETIARAQIKAKDNAGAMNTLTLAKKATAGLPETEDYEKTNKSNSYESITEVMIAAGDLKEAWNTAALTTDSFYRGYAFGKLAVALVEAGKIDLAKKAYAEVPEDSSYHSNAKNALEGVKEKTARKKFEAGDIKGALAAAANMEEGYTKSYLYRDISDLKRDAGDMDGAIAAAQKMSELDDRAETLTEIAEDQFENDQVNAARKTLNLAIKTLEGLDRSEYDYQYGLYRIALEWLDMKDIKSAISTANRIPEGEHKSDAYDDIIARLAEKGDIGGAFDLIPYVTEEYDRGWAFWHIVRAQLKKGDVADAKKTAERITNNDRKMDAYEEIAEAQAEAGEADGALETATLMQDEAEKSAIFKQLAATLSGQGNFEKAIDIAGGIFNPKIRAEAYLNLAGNFQKIGYLGRMREFLDQAVKTANGVPDDVQRAGALYNLANTYVFYQNVPPQEVRQLLFMAAKAIAAPPGDEDSGIGDELAVKLMEYGAFAEAMDLAGRINSESSRDDTYEYMVSGLKGRNDFPAALAFSGRVKDLPDRATLYLSLAEAMMGMDRIDAARKNLERCLDTIAAMKEGQYASYGLNRIAILQAKLGDFDGAFKSVSQITDTDYYAYSYPGIVAAQIKAKDIPAAKKTISLALASVEKVKGKSYRRNLLSGIALKQVETGDLSDALKTIERIKEEDSQDDAYYNIASQQAKDGDFNGALKTASRIREAAQKAALYHNIASTLKAADKKDDKIRTLNRALQTASGIKDPYSRASWFRSISLALLAADDKGSATSALRRAADAIPQIESLSNRASAYGWMAGAWAQAGEAGKALKMAASVPDRLGKLAAYEAVARGLVKAGNTKGAREALKTSRGLFPLPPDEEKNWMESVIFGALLGEKDKAAARSVLAKISDGYWRDKSLLSLVYNQVGAEDFPGALETAGKISRSADKTAASKYIYDNRLKAGDVATARQSADLIPDPYLKGAALSTLANTQAAAGDHAASLATVTAVPLPLEKAWSYIILAEANLAEDDAAVARKGYSAAIKVIEGLKSPYWEAHSLAAVSRGMRQAGANAEAETAMRQATGTARKITDAAAQGWTMVWITGNRPTKDKKAASKDGQKPAEKNEEVEAWINVAESRLNDLLYKDVKGFIRSLAEKDAESMVSSLADGAAKLGQTMHELQKKNAQWREKRSPAANPAAK